MSYNDRNVVMEDMRIVLRNFQGKEGQYNREGERNFAVLLDDDVADAMAKDGWNVKQFRQKNPDEPTQAFLSITVNFRGRPPKVVMITSRGRTLLTEDEIEMLDWVDIRTVDLIVRPYEWAINGKTGVTAYLKSLFVTIEEDELDRKYADLEDVRARGGRSD